MCGCFFFLLFGDSILFFFCLTRLDSNVFDAKSYYEQLIMTSSLPTLLKREHDLITGTYFFILYGWIERIYIYTEIRELDSERQSLVYNHHHELVAASDTIAVVRVDDELSTLNST